MAAVGQQISANIWTFTASQTYVDFPEKRERASKKTTEQFKDPKQIELASKAHKKNWLDEDFRKKQEKARKDQKLFDTKIELKIQNYLINRKILFETQKLVSFRYLENSFPMKMFCFFLKIMAYKSKRIQ